MVHTIQSPNTVYSEDYIQTKYKHQFTQVVNDQPNVIKVIPKEVDLNFRIERNIPKLGVMLVGWGGNNGTTVTAAVLANSLGLTWRTKDGVQSADYLGSLVQSSTVYLGSSSDGDVYVPMRDLLPMVHPNEIIFDGWDISGMNLADAMARAKVLDIDLQCQLEPHMKKLKPRPSIYDPNFIATNQADRADNVIKGTKLEQVEQIRKDIRDFRERENLEKIIVLWTANTERYCQIEKGLNDTGKSLLLSIQKNQSEISPSTLFAVASILEECSFLNGSPQNTFVPGVVDLAEQHGVFIGGDDLKSGQTKMKSVLTDFLISAGLKPVSIVSYNHLGNNDGKNLSAPEQFRSKEISKSNVVDDMVASNTILYKPGEHPDHCVVIKYVPYVGDSKRAMDEYTSRIMLGGHNTIVIHNTCEDSLLAAPIILDLVIVTELFQRVQVKTSAEEDFQPFHHILSILSFFFKAPLIPAGTNVVNAFFKQRLGIENIFRAFIGLPPINHIDMKKLMKTLPVFDQVRSVNDTKKRAAQHHLKDLELVSKIQLEGMTP